MMRLYLCVCQENLFHVEKIESTKLFQWFRNNYLKTNKGKSHVELLADDSIQINVKCSLLSLFWFGTGGQKSPNPIKFFNNNSSVTFENLSF